MFAVAPRAYGSDIPELNDSVLYILGSDEQTYSVLVNNVVEGEVKANNTGTDRPMTLVLNGHKALWGSLKDIYADIAIVPLTHHQYVNH